MPKRPAQLSELPKIQKASKARKVLDYWYAIEFLAQDKYDDRWEIRTKMQRAQSDFAKGRFKGKAIWSYRELQNSRSIYGIISADAVSCGMKTWGNITIYIGKTKREACIECIAKILPKSGEGEERPEKAYDSIAWASLQIAPDGTYVDHSLSLSTIIWSMNQIKNSKSSLSGSLDERQYRSAVEELEKKFFSRENGDNQSAGDPQAPQAGVCDSQKYTDEGSSIQEFSPAAVTAKTLKALYQQLEKDFVRGTVELTGRTESGPEPWEYQESQADREHRADQELQAARESRADQEPREHREYQEIYGLYFQLFADGKARERMDEDNYLGLSHDYFSEDIKFVLQKTEDGSLAAGDYLCGDLIRYLSVLGDDDENSEKDRIDLVKPEDKEKFFRQLSEILEVGNAPLGKWPSKFMPAFMQQVAVNLCIRKGTSELYGLNGDIFSVNGPPGTGKTTLLKEIVVSNIIERAILLAEYQDPDEAFEKHSFLHGDKPGHAYSAFTRGWYSLKNDSINDYSVLVTSCNNAAVENVSKELPLGTDLLNNLKPAPEDTKEYAGMLGELSGLFDPAQSRTYETISRKSCQDVYFTEYAKGLFGNDGVWGLMAAPLGRKANISAFYNHVLYPLYWDFYPGKDFKDVRIEKYAQARAEFRSQLRVVVELREQLKEICALVRRRAELMTEQEELERKLPKKRAEGKALGEAAGLRIEKLRELFAQKVSVMQRIAEKRDGLANRISETEQEISGQSDRKRKLLEQEVAARKSTGVLGKLFNRKKAEAGEQLAAEYHEEAMKAEAESGRQEKLLEELRESLREAQAELEQAVRSKGQTDADISDEETGISETKRQIHELENRLEKIKEELRDMATEYFGKVHPVAERQETERQETERLETMETSIYDQFLDAAQNLDVCFIDRLLSSDSEESTAAQVANPWFTKRYNIEREKLFYYAMRLGKEFVLASKCCRDNFKTLGHYWGMQPGDDKKRIVFHREDRESFAGALYQTLFLLVPVLSSTFASLGTLFRDARQAGMIGTLIVDEAGQAQPQMAVGALYRSRKAMIVGDPKQVEPVVTDDLSLLKRAFDDGELKSYKAKTVSVQSFADRLNRFGTWLDNGTDYPEWVGCPLLVHRRCISPMYDISNEISYNGIMKQQTREPDAKKASSFVYGKSQWINVAGKEKGNKNHFVEEQARKVCEILELAFSKSDDPSLYIISPFTSVVNGMRAYIREYKRQNAGTSLDRCEAEWIDRNIGTVHTFQGKEANEVIFLLGCDKSREARGAIRWVNANIVNVAATRAKFRLYVIGDEEAWQNSSCVRKAKMILDTFAIRKIKEILEEPLPEEEKADALKAASASLPSVTSFQVKSAEGEDGDSDYSVDTGSLLYGLNQSFAATELSGEQLEKFGFHSTEDLRQLPPEVRENLLLGMKLFYLLSPVYKINNQLDASCCAILFCKAIELQMRDCFEESLKAIFPDAKIKGQGKGRGQVELKDARARELTLGAFRVLIRGKCSELGRRMELKGEKEYGTAWWTAFEKRLVTCTDRRNQCCHAGLFSWKDQSYLLADLFRRGNGDDTVPIEGILFASRVGKRLS